MAELSTRAGNHIQLNPRRFVWITASLPLCAAVVFAVLWWSSSRPEERIRRARRALTAGDDQTVLRESRVLLNTDGYESQGRLLAGLLQTRTGRYVPALYNLQFAARDDVTAVEALTAASECYYHLGQLTEATKTARTAIARDPDALEARRWLASAYYDLGAMDHAVAQLEWISTKVPGDSRPEYLLGLISKDNERFADAIVHYRESLRRDAQAVHRERLLLELAESLVKLSRFDEALDVLNQSRSSAPVLTLAAECRQNLGHTDEALDLLKRARELDPTYAPACVQLGMFYLLLGRHEEARDALEEAVKLAPHSSQAHFQLSQAYTRTGDNERSAEQLRLMTEIQSIEREFSELHGVASEHPEDADVRHRIGVLARKLGKTDLAQMWFRAALALEPTHALARAALSEK